MLAISRVALTLGAFLLVSAVLAPRAAAEATPSDRMNHRLDLAKFDLPTSYGEQINLGRHVGKKATVLVFVSTECPLSNGYVPVLNRLEEEFSPRGVSFLAINPNSKQSLREMAVHREQYSLKLTLVKDPQGQLARICGATICPEVCVLNPEGRVLYHGRIDDRYPKRGGAPVPPKREDLRLALESILAGEAVAVAETEAIGCPIVHEFPGKGAAPKAGANPAVTFNKQVSRILQANCQECHRPNGVAPFELVTYDDAVLWAEDIVHFTRDGSMPPWMPEVGFVAFHNERRMSPEDLAMLEEWVAAGCPEGDPADAPESVVFNDGWTSGTPDVVYEMPEEYELGPEGPDDYRHFVIPTDFPEDKFIAALEVIPGNRRIVHHVIAYVDLKGAGRKLDAADPRPGYSTNSGGLPGFLPDAGIGGWAPGNIAQPLPEGMALVLPAGADIVLQVHYHRTGKVEKDRTRIGLYFAKPPVTRIVRALPVAAIEFRVGLKRIPAGHPNYPITTSMMVPEDLILVGTIPHMHLLGKNMKVTATLPDGTVQPIVHIPRWDFNWQGTYRYQEPIHLPEGTRLDLVAHYDNSENNPWNPFNPPRTAYWGEATYEEMCICFLEVVPAAEATSAEDLKLPDMRKLLTRYVRSQFARPKAVSVPDKVTEAP